METRQLGGLWPVSALTLGGGGVGQLWGETTREECIATVREAVDLGITLLDMAPSYGNGEAESVVGAAFKGNLPSGIRVTTKHRLGETDPDKIEQNIRDGLDDYDYLSMLHDVNPSLASSLASRISGSTVRDLVRNSTLLREIRLEIGIALGN